MATDVCILILPLPVIMSLQMTIKRRLGVLAVITMGGSAIIVSGLRAIILFEFAASPDFTWVLGKMVIISSVEMQVAILAANMPSLKAFWSCWRMHRLGRGEGVGIEYSFTRARNSRRTDNVEMGSRSAQALSMPKAPRDIANGRVYLETEDEERLWAQFDSVEFTIVHKEGSVSHEQNNDPVH
jgi:hypothetical protein